MPSAPNVNPALKIPNAYEEGQKQRIKDGNASIADQKDMFLKLMIAQMRNQDPTAPMDSKDMMANITQMSQVEQFMSMSKSMESIALAQGVGMMGKDIEFDSPIYSGQTQVGSQVAIGKVDHVIQEGGQVKLVVNVEGYRTKPAFGPGTYTPVTEPTVATISGGQVTRIS